MGQQPRRARELGVAPGRVPPGPTNSIVDVPGIRVGQVTISEGSDLRTGVTAVVPGAVDRAGGRLPAGLFVGNGFGKLVGATQLAELGEIETPILLTGTLSAFRAADALVTYMLGLAGNETVSTLNPVVGETNDGYLSDIRRRPLREDHVRQALTTASTDPIAEGCVGAGTGTVALGFKAGIGSSSRVVQMEGRRDATVGVVVQANFSGTLRVHGVPIRPAEALPALAEQPHPPGNSCMMVVATDAGLDARQLTRTSRRAVFGMARVGSDFAHGSGDYAISVDVGEGRPPPDDVLDPVFLAVQEAVEEAVLNSLFMAGTTVGQCGHTRHAVPHGFVLERCGAAGVLSPT